jgi:hypothetical protein
LEAGLPTSEPMVLRTSDRLSLFGTPSPFGRCAGLETLPKTGGGAPDRTRSAHDFGGAGGEAGLEVCSESVGDGSVTGAAEPSDGLLSIPLSVLSFGTDSFEVSEIMESLCCFREMVGLVGRTGTAGIMGATGLLLGCVGVCWDFILWAGTAEEGVVGCVEPVSEGASDVWGVGVSIGSGTDTVSTCVSASISPTVLGSPSFFLSSVIGSMAASTATNGNTMGSLDSDERVTLRFRRGARRGKPVSPDESQGTYIQRQQRQDSITRGITDWRVEWLSRQRQCRRCLRD